MPIDSRSNNSIQKQIRQRNYLNKDFDGFRSDLEVYIRKYFPNIIKDISPNGLAGMFVDLASYVGDVQSFYLDHQFLELDATTAIEPKNIEALLKEAGVPIVGASPAVVSATISLIVPAEVSVNGAYVPQTSVMPIIYEGSTCIAGNSTVFEMVETIDFSELNIAGELLADVSIEDRDGNNNPTSFRLSRDAVCVSGVRATESFSVDGFESFKRITLSKDSVTQVISVRDNFGNTFYEVGSLTEDSVFKVLANPGYDNDVVKKVLQLVPAPYRFIREMSLQTRLTTLTFGGGDATSLEDDIVPDPSEYALPLYGKTNFGRFSLNPSKLLQTMTLGTIVPNSTVSVTYRYGGGLAHNIPEENIRDFVTLNFSYPRSPNSQSSSAVTKTIGITNRKAARGGEDAPTLDELKLTIPEYKASQERIVTSADVLARVYTLPAELGRAFRAAIIPNLSNPNSSILYIICRNSEGQLAVATDTLKKNLQTYLNNYRFVSDAIDILDTRVVNFQIQYRITVDPQLNRKIVLQNINTKLKAYFNVKNFDINQPINISDLQNVIYNNQGVISVQMVKIINIFGVVGGNTYSDAEYDINSNTKNGIIYPPNGGIFELRYKDDDIQGTLI